MSRADSRTDHERAIALLRAGRSADALAVLRSLPQTPDVLVNTALASGDADYFRAALDADPKCPEALTGYANHLIRAGRPDDAGELFARALAADPRDVHALRGLAKVRMDQARAADAARAMYYCATLTRDPADFSTACFYALHADDVDADGLHRQYVRRFVRPGAVPPPRTWDGTRPLRVGYVSAFWRGSTTGKFMLQVIENHSDAVEVFIYSDTARPDAITQRFKARANVWRDTGAMTNAQLAAAVRADGIDVLVDRQDHLDGGRRMGLFALRPAPVIVSYSGHPHPSYLPGMVRVTDTVVDPAETGEPVIRLERCMRAFAPDPAAPPVAPPPIIANGHATLGAFNRAPKISGAAARCWGEVLRALPSARLVVLASGGEFNGSVRRLLESAGVDGARLSLVPETGDGQYLARFASIDALLDTFPYNGTTTICDALWQGVPVVTLAGESVRARMGASILTGVGLPELVADTPAAYVAAAVALASDPERLRMIRATMRGRMTASPLMDGAGLARRLESALCDLARA